MFPVQAVCVDIGIDCIPVSGTGLAEVALTWGISLGVSLTILFIIIGGYGVATSAGDPERLEAAKQRITAAVAGLLFILLSVLILRIIGEEVIGIRPGLFGL